MNYEDRFYNCDGFGFPAVSQYDYETNLPTRGIDNRQFRWEDVAVESSYLFKEATSGDTFESNSFVPVIATGVNYITTGTGMDTTSYVGWIASGNRTIYIGPSGIFVSSGDLPLFTGSLIAHPIDGDYAIGLYSVSGLNFPSVYSSSLATGDEGPMIPNNTHQVFTQAKLNYGSSGYLKVYVRGWNAGEVVAYYNPYTSTWDTSAVTSGFSISSSGYTTIKYDFTTSNFPAVAPSSYDLFVQSVTSGSFITVDNLHIDAYLKKNAFVDYIVPSGYIIQITPDLGWHDLNSMFQSTDSLVNPYLKQLGPFTTDSANLVDNLDNTVTATIDESDFSSAVIETYTKFLWRAIALSPDGSLGPGGLPQRFNYIGSSLNNQFNVSEIIDESKSVKIITGNKSSRMTILVDGLTDNPNLEYPTTTTWKLTVHLTSASRTLLIQGKDTSGALTSVARLVLNSELYDQVSRSVWNVFDEHGLVAGIDRLSLEDNYNYSNRIKNSYKNRPGPSFAGIVNGASVELDLTKISDGLILSINKNEFNISRATQVDLEVTSYSLRIRTPSMIITETLLIDNIFNTISLTYLPKETPEFSNKITGAKINQNLFEVKEFTVSDTNRYQYVVKGTFEPGTFIQVKYSYIKEFLFKDYPTLELLIQAVNNFTDGTGFSPVTLDLSSKLSGNESCLGLFLTAATILSNSNYSIPWAPVYVKKISDEGFKDYFLTSSYNLTETEYYKYVTELKDQTKIFWGSIEADRGRWDSADSKDLGMDAIPTLFDPPLSYFVSNKTGQPVRLEAVQAWGREYLGLDNEYLRNLGLSSVYLHPGVAHTSDLVPTIYVTSSRVVAESSSTNNIGPVKNSNNIVVFSGQK